MADEFEIKSRYHLYINEKTMERMKEIEDHLKDNYQGIGDFVEKKMEEEQALGIDERIRRKKQKVEEEKEHLQKLERIRKERSQQDRLQDKRELLKDKQDKLREIAEDGIKSREEVVKEEVEKRVERGYDIDRDSEIIQEAVERRLERRPDVDELVENVQRLQEQVKDLNGGPEDYFMDLGELDGVKAWMVEKSANFSQYNFRGEKTAEEALKGLRQRLRVSGD